jgi:cellulose synthase/poly-beta-1,6-N-acetylglucosamine synthase-like glycosyltransferase
MILIVLPAYNEAAGLPALLRSIRQVMDEGRLAYKVVVVDDGSSDGTWDAITADVAEMPIVPVRHEVNRGLAEGAALGPAGRGGPGRPRRRDRHHGRGQHARARARHAHARPHPRGARRS